MIGILRNIYRSLKKKNKFFWSVNWIKTYYFNYKKFPYSIAKKLPVIFYGKVKFSSIEGDVIIDAPIKRAMIGFGQTFEFPTTSKGTSEILLDGKMVFKGNVQFGKDVSLLIGKNAYFEMGHMATFGSNVNLICVKKVILGDWTGIGYDSQVIDTNSHPMINTITNERYPITGDIILGNYNSISNKVSIMLNTKTPNSCVIASNSLCNKDYTVHGENILLGGIPAKLLLSNFARDYDSERENLIKNKVIKW